MDRDADIRHEEAEPVPLSDVQPARRPSRSDFGRAKASYARGDGVAHVVVGAWLRTWGRPGRKDFRDWLADQDG